MRLGCFEDPELSGNSQNRFHLPRSSGSPHSPVYNTANYSNVNIETNVVNKKETGTFIFGSDSSDSELNKKSCESPALTRSNDDVSDNKVIDSSVVLTDSDTGVSKIMYFFSHRNNFDVKENDVVPISNQFNSLKKIISTNLCQSNE